MKSIALCVAIAAFSLSAVAADASKAVAMTDAQMAKATAGNLFQSNTNAGDRVASAVQSDAARAFVYQSHRGVTTCVNACP
jgi:hypothetical protein